jgi:asparagine synthase (glutamine-hydrolysing)
MCGIAGIVGVGDTSAIYSMTECLAHRGPDDQGYHVGDGVALGARRLSIIDITGGHQPMSNEDGTVWVVFNGEIYNYAQLRHRVRQKGHHLRTRCDTEILVHLYEDYSDACVHLLRGMFAFAIWDSRRRRLLLARDRLGIKPLYYTQAAGAFLFASEAKALLRHPAVQPEINSDVLDVHLTLQYVPGSRTLFKNIHKLPPGHLLVYENGRSRIGRYWDVVFGEGGRRVSVKEAAEEFTSRFAEAVSLHLMSDVPVGVLLSGGLDSSSVVATMKQVSSARVQTFTAGFGAARSTNELSDARAVADHFTTDHHEVMVSMDAVELLPKLVWHFDEPVADAAALPTYMLCRFARRTVPVILTGEGADEVLAGYPRYAWFVMAKRLQRALPPAARRRLLSMARLIPIPRRYAKAVGDILSDRTDLERHLGWVGNFEPTLKRQLFSPDLLCVANDDGIGFVAAHFNGHDRQPSRVLHSLLALDMHTWLVDDVLTKVDKMSMAASVEARVPFLDHELVEWTAALPVDVKLRHLHGKRLLRHAMRGTLPLHTRRRRKQAFVVPTDQWFRGELRDFAGDVLLGRRLRERGWFNAGRLHTLLEDHWAGANHGQALWSLLCLELWARTFLDREWPTAVPASIS